jgi:hypothetical protein
MDNKDYETRINEAESTIAAQFCNLAQIYTNRIRDNYHNIPGQLKRYEILGEIKSLDEKVTELAIKPYNPKTLEVKPIKKKRKQAENIFDFKKAKETRDEVYSTQRGLANEMIKDFKLKQGIKGILTAISTFENGRKIPSIKSESQITKAYLSKIKDIGYNPYNL